MVAACIGDPRYGSLAVTGSAPRESTRKRTGASKCRPRTSVARAASASQAVCKSAGISRGLISAPRSMTPILVVPFGRMAATADAGSARSAGSVITRIAATGNPCAAPTAATTWELGLIVEDAYGRRESENNRDNQFQRWCGAWPLRIHRRHGGQN